MQLVDERIAEIREDSQEFPFSDMMRISYCAERRSSLEERSDMNISRCLTNSAVDMALRHLIGRAVHPKPDGPLAVFVMRLIAQFFTLSHLH